MVYLRLVLSVKRKLLSGARGDSGILIAIGVIPADYGVAVLFGNCGEGDISIADLILERLKSKLGLAVEILNGVVDNRLFAVKSNVCLSSGSNSGDLFTLALCVILPAVELIARLNGCD